MAKDMPTRTVEAQIKANPNEIEPLAQTRLGTTWQLRTADSMRLITAPGYLDPVLSHGIRVNDRIEFVSLATTPATHGSLAVDEIRSPEPGQPRAIVRVLHSSERSEN